MKRMILWIFALTSFLISIVILYGVISYFLLSISPFNRAVLPDTGVVIAVIVSAISSVILSVYISRKVYLRLKIKIW